MGQISQKDQKSKRKLNEEIIRNSYLRGRYGPARIVGHDTIDNGLKFGIPISAPNKIVARKLNEELFLTGNNRRRYQRAGILKAFVSRGRGVASHNGPINGEDNEHEKERREKLEKRGLPVPPWEQEVFLQKRRVLMPKQGKTALQIHIRWRQRRRTSLCLLFYLRQRRGVAFIGFILVKPSHQSQRSVRIQSRYKAETFDLWMRFCAAQIMEEALLLARTLTWFYATNGIGSFT